jgi:hypothetical protein
MGLKCLHEIYQSIYLNTYLPACVESSPIEENQLSSRLCRKHIHSQVSTYLPISLLPNLKITLQSPSPPRNNMPRTASQSQNSISPPPPGPFPRLPHTYPDPSVVRM